MSGENATITIKDPAGRDWDKYVHSEEFNRECIVQANKARQRASAASDHGDSYYEDSIWPNSNDHPSVELSPYEVPRVESNLYYAGLGPNGRGPKLIYRTSDDKFVEPEGPAAYRRLMKLCPVPEDHELGRDGVWDSLRDQIVKVLDERGIDFTSVDLVQFTWLDKQDNHEIQGDDDEVQNDGNLISDNIPSTKPIEDGKRHTTNPTIWVGVLPNTLTGAVAHESATEILGLVKDLGIVGVDVAYRESVARFLHGPDLFAPSSNQDPPKDLIDSFSASLSLPIAGQYTMTQGTLGCYFRVRNDLYAVTARHNVIPLGGCNNEYTYSKSARAWEVIVMGDRAFTNCLESIKNNIDSLNDAVKRLEKRTGKLTRRVDANGDGAQKSVDELSEARDELAKTLTKVAGLNFLLAYVKKKWSKSKSRVIGYVVWAPPIGVGAAPYCYTRDVCVIKLYRKKFRGLVINVLGLGPEIFPAKSKPLIDVRSEFDSPDAGLSSVQGLLSVTDLNNPNSSLEGEYMSHVRKYNVAYNLDSVELAILPHDTDPVFSRGGDSGALIVDSCGRFIGLLTGGTSQGTTSSDVTFATPMVWVWELIKEKFPGAKLCFDDLGGLLANAA